MDHDVLRNWKYLRGEASSIWSDITAQDLDQIDGRRDRLVRVLEERYGFARKRAEREVDLLVKEFENRLRMAA